MATKHSQLLPWYVGIAAIVGLEAMFGFQFFAGQPVCGPDVGPIFLALLIVLPAVYLVLMYLALKSQP